MPDIPGRMKSEGFISPAPPRNAPKEVRVYMAKTYGHLRKTRFPGEIPENKTSASKLTHYLTRRKFQKKYPELFRKNPGHMKRKDQQPALNKAQVDRGARMEYREHPEFGKKAARQIAIDHITRDPASYTYSEKSILKPVSVIPAKTVSGRKVQARDLRRAAQQQRRWAKTAGNEQVSERRRAGKLRRSGNPVTAQDTGNDAKIAGTFAKERLALAKNYDLQAARIEAISRE
jgi:hypothetical protein